MIFKWTSSKNKVAAEAQPQSQVQPEAANDASAAEPAAKPAAEAAVAETAEAGYSTGKMAKDLFEKVVPFKSRATSQDGDGAAHAFSHESLFGQDHAVDMVRFGAAVTGHDYNMIIAAPPGVSAAAFAREALKGALKTDGVSDWIAVPGLGASDRLSAIALPSGRAAAFKAHVARAIGELQDALVETFQSETYQLRRLAIDDMHAHESDGAVGGLIQRAAAKNVAVLRLPKGFSVAPMHDGKVVRPEVLAQLPETMRREVEARVRGFQAELESLLTRVPHLDRARRSELRDLHEDVVAKAVALAFADVREAFGDVPAVLAHIDAIEKDMRAQATLVAEARERTSEIWRRYGVTVLQETRAREAPVIDLIDLRAETLAGRFDHLRARSGALHQANGGALLLSADGLLHDPDAREILVRTLLQGEIASLDAASPISVPFQGKIVVTGERETCERLFHVDQRVGRLFKVVIELRSAVARTKDGEAAFAAVVQALISRHKSKPIDAAGTARLLEEACRAAVGEALISAAIDDTADLLREASAWAELSGDGKIERAHVERALAAREERRAGAAASGYSAGRHTAKGQGPLAKVFGS